MAKEAFDEAVTYIKKEFATKPDLVDWVRNQTSIEEVRETVLKAENQYNLATQGSRVRKWLRGFSSRLLYYGNVLDVLAQHHPEYVSLAWGAIKFIFTVSSPMYG